MTEIIKGYEYDELTPYYHADTTITFGQLLDEGVIDWTLDKWTWNRYNDEQFNRCNKYFENVFYTRELRYTPVELWRKRFIGKINLVMERLKPIYELLDENPNFWQEFHTYEKERKIGSAFPQTMLSGNSDYATDGEDSERELVHDGKLLDLISDIYNNYINPDEYLIEQLDTLFTQVFTLNVNGL